MAWGSAPCMSGGKIGRRRSGGVRSPCRSHISLRGCTLTTLVGIVPRDHLSPPTHHKLQLSLAAVLKPRESKRLRWILFGVSESHAAMRRQLSQCTGRKSPLRRSEPQVSRCPKDGTAQQFSGHQSCLKLRDCDSFTLRPLGKETSSVFWTALLCITTFHSLLSMASCSKVFGDIVIRHIIINIHCLLSKYCVC